MKYSITFKIYESFFSLEPGLQFSFFTLVWLLTRDRFFTIILMYMYIQKGNGVHMYMFTYLLLFLYYTLDSFIQIYSFFSWFERKQISKGVYICKYAIVKVQVCIKKTFHVSHPWVLTSWVISYYIQSSSDYPFKLVNPYYHSFISGDYGLVL